MKGKAKEGKGSEQIEGQKNKEKEKDNAVLIFGFFFSNQLNDSSRATVDLVVTSYTGSRDEAIRFSNWQDVVKQLFGYLRRILREQLDRRFVFGLTLGPDMMTVWLHDRSGVIGTKSAIDIHKVSETRILQRPMKY